MSPASIHEDAREALSDVYAMLRAARRAREQAATSDPPTKKAAPLPERGPSDSPRVRQRGEVS